MADIILSDAGEARVLEIMFTNANGVVKVEASTRVGNGGCKVVSMCGSLFGYGRQDYRPGEMDGCSSTRLK